MTGKKQHTTTVQNPHDSLFQAAWGKLENARSFLESYLPEDVRRHVDLSTLSISKDSFVDPDLKAFYSDILYRVNLSGFPGFVYVLFEHKSYYDRHIHLQLMSYMLKIWRQFLDQQPPRSEKLLPIIIPLVIYHGKRPWSEDAVRLSSLLAGPVETLQKIVRHALSEKEGEYVMTLAEKLRSEGIKLGEERGIKLGEERGIKKGKMEAIELGMVLKFPENVPEVMAEVKLIQDMDMLDKIKDAIKTARDGSQIVELAKRCRKNS